MKLFCLACNGRLFRDKTTGEFIWKPVYLKLEIYADKFIAKAGPCSNCKVVNVFIKGIDMDYKPLEHEHLVLLSDNEV